MQHNHYTNKNFFQGDGFILDHVFNLQKTMIANVALPSVFGSFNEQQSYLDAVDLLIASTMEAKHRDEILEEIILPNLKKNKSLLDIGIGNGILTRLIGDEFTDITLIDPSQNSLDKIPDRHWKNNNPIIKILGRFEDLELPQVSSYDLIVLSHTIYYVDLDIRAAVIDKLFNLLNPDGTILLIFNAGGTRYEMTQHFDGKNFDFIEVFKHLEKEYSDNTTIYISTEEIVSDNIDVMSIISGVCLKDAGTYASSENLMEYLGGLHEDGLYKLSMEQTIITINK